ncbi:hypothetical protein PILCRDRAFT_87202 [Piloderma croceum F 1598]|uniref:Uncharacterized protein n=1 Tax=Piloderma croceum (strain F 1598) TaxID=765440 RepID=A0A0C3G2F9_PILCF|nr:hypothetical protein PILCRDRAFT_87202 [Piloderma croceum F 1598]
MPTATTPTTTPLKPATNQSTPASLRTLYNRAARAFLHRDIHQTHSLLQHAFSLLLPPAIHDDSDSLAPHRRKWDILRITLETTLYSSNNHHDHPLPDSLQQILSLPSHSLLTTLHQRSLALFTPTPTNPSSAYLPSQVLITLVLSSMKLNCAAAGRTFIEDWLGKSPGGGGGEEYEKVLDIYCLHVLPRLEEWDYAFEFLQYENELAPQKRQVTRRLGLLGAGGAGAGEVVRRRLGLGGWGGGGVVGRIWGELVKAIGDTVRMGGGGLV